jgi:transketolase
MELLKRVHAKNLASWAHDKPEVLVLSADLTSSTEADLFRNSYPSRFISCGIAEQNMLSVSGGLAREGFIPFVHTFAVFIYRRAYDQVTMSVAYPNLPVKMFGFLPGITTPGGATHQAIEDISVMRSLPNMTVLECGDATDVESVLDVAYAVNGPVYVRMLRGEIPRLFDGSERMRLDTPRLVSPGSDITIISSGICTEEAIEARLALVNHGVSVELVHISTLKPFDNPMILESLNKPRYGIITVENHTTTGGLGSIIAEKLTEHSICKPLIKLGLHDCFAHGASRQYLTKEFGIDAQAIVKSAGALCKTDFKTGSDEFGTEKIRTQSTEEKPEDL